MKDYHGDYALSPMIVGPNFVNFGISTQSSILYPYTGIQTVLKASVPKSDIERWYWHGLDGTQRQRTEKKVVRSDDR